MELGDLKDSLLNLGKEKGKEFADNILGERQEEGGITGTVAGFGKDMLDKTLGSNEQDDAEGNEASSSEGADNNSEDMADETVGSNEQDDTAGDEATSSEDADNSSDNDSEDASSDDDSDDDNNSDEENN